MRRNRILRAGMLAGPVLSLFLTITQAVAQTAATNPASLEEGAYLFKLAGCAGCHTDVKNKGALLAGGRALETPFGTFFGPNITADPTYGIGTWSDADFVVAVRLGRRPDGSHYFPVFPYTSFASMREADILAIKAYIFTLPPVARPNTPHEVAFPFGFRPLMTAWKWLFFSPRPFVDTPGESPAWNRGAYLVEALSHCGECHTPRGLLGALDRDMAFAGSEQGPQGGRIPNITTDAETGIGRWSEGDIKLLLRSGLTPTGDVVGSTMGEVIQNSTSHLSPADLDAVVTYLRALTPIVNQIGKPKAAKKDDDW